jgi:hypothetical protein
MTHPYLSIVVTSRNDNHGGALLKRMQICINSLIEQCRISNLPAELIIVEWNPPKDRPKFIDALTWPKEMGSCQIRIIEVPPEIHNTYANSDKLRLFQMIAKNVGIRRARGEYVLATNIDILFSPELIEFFAQKKLHDDKMYRVDRYDVKSDAPLNSSISDLMTYCKDNITRINTKNGTIPSNQPVEKWQKFREIKTILFFQIRRIYRKIRGRKERCKLTLHTHACGDFTLMKKNHWAELQGYPEFPVCSMHIDSLFCYIAHYAGVTEEILAPPFLTYHIDHESGWSTDREKMESFFNKLERKGIPSLDGSQVFDWACFMQKIKGPIFFNNGDSWGLGDKNLHEDRVNFLTE